MSNACSPSQMFMPVISHNKKGEYACIDITFPSDVYSIKSNKSNKSIIPRYSPSYSLGGFKQYDFETPSNEQPYNATSVLIKNNLNCGKG